ncbi:hypothetical protein EZV62_018959 [Acer yangbiense]|uniref:Wall-associated receptor kinase galacturonan-binding domain-containing protein n=1 Tax=Acer yangbiense TaxID=1000413 RepID=A0A5C7H988_9ROSI|nr:hypothetical protein EZV62_018959 [Acer yangbiense]
MIPPLLFQLIILLSWPINALAESPVIAKPGCPTSCGNGTVSIPFPFGIGDGCYLDYCDKEEKQVQNKCRSAFLVDQEWLGNNMFLFNTETSDSPIKALGLKHVPVLLDWGIDESSFDRIDSNSSQEYTGTSGCKVFVNISTSTIDYFTNETSYNTSSVRQCSCRRGYEGNPYLLQGCNVLSTDTL